MNSDHPKQTFVKMLRGIRAGPRGWDELGPSKTPKIWEGSEHIVCQANNEWTSPHRYGLTSRRDVRAFYHVRAGPRRWDELRPVKAKI